MRDAEMRDEFEKWLRSIWTQGYGCPMDADGDYSHKEARVLWNCWKNAWNTRAQQAEAVAWMVNREGDPTFPRTFNYEEGAKRCVASVTLRPFATMQPLFTHPQPQVDGDGGLREALEMIRDWPTESAEAMGYDIAFHALKAMAKVAIAHGRDDNG